mmetsp:Transcript_25974/g.78244  ORF Transcript_25974/g.78244 Transcript_25974/m.78244 type:complete len:223 (-) Transcript_25974:1669-2337(-)
MSCVANPGRGRPPGLRAVRRRHLFEVARAEPIRGHTGRRRWARPSTLESDWRVPDLDHRAGGPRRHSGWRPRPACRPHRKFGRRQRWGGPCPLEERRRVAGAGPRRRRERGAVDAVLRHLGRRRSRDLLRAERDTVDVQRHARGGADAGCASPLRQSRLVAEFHGLEARWWGHPPGRFGALHGPYRQISRGPRGRAGGHWRCARHRRRLRHPSERSVEPDRV